MALTGYYGQFNGPGVNTTFPDQPDVGRPGKLVFASDQNKTDAYPVGEENGVLVGRVVKLVDGAGDIAAHMPDECIAYMDSEDDVPAGFVICEEYGAFTDDVTGENGYPFGRMARILKSGRIFVKVKEAVDNLDAVHVCVAADTVGAVDYVPGDIAAEAGAAHKWVTFTGATFKRRAAAGGLSYVEVK